MEVRFLGNNRPPSLHKAIFKHISQDFDVHPQRLRAIASKIKYPNIEFQLRD